MKEKLFCVIFFLVLMLLIPSAYCSDNTITFGVYTSDKPTVMYKKFKPIIGYLQERLRRSQVEINIKLKVCPTYLDCIDDIVKGKVDFARIGPSSYILAKEINNDIRLLVMEHKNGAKRFKGIFITAKTSSIQSIRELKGKSFAFGNENSTIGRYLSQAELVKSGVYASDLKSFNYLDRHDKVALAVAFGNYDAGVVKENTFKKYAESKGLKKIGDFLNVTKPWVVKSGFSKSIFNVLQDALLKLKDKTILQVLKQDGFLLATDEDYDFVRKEMVISKGFEKR